MTTVKKVGAGMLDDEISMNKLSTSMLSPRVFFATFKKRITKQKIYTARNEAKAEIFNFIEMLYNPIKWHSHIGEISPVKFEEVYFLESSPV